jgi:hypothetical protein
MENIQKLKNIEKTRNSPSGYFNNSVKFSSKLRYVTIAGEYDNLQFDNFIIAAMKEKEKDLIKRAFELEEAYFQKIKRLAKIEAANILAGEELLNSNENE